MEQFLVVNIVLLWIVGLLNLLLGLALVRRVNKSSANNVMTPLEAGAKAPDFVAETLGGEEVTLDAYARQAVAFVFVTPNCSACVERLPALGTLRQQIRPKGLELVLVSFAGTQETQAYVDQHSVQLPVLVATASFFRDYKVVGTPYYCIIDEQGKVRSSGFMGAEWDDLTQNWGTNGSVSKNA